MYNDYSQMEEHMNYNSIKFHRLGHAGTPANPRLDFVQNEEGNPSIAFSGFDSKEQCDAFDITDLDRVIEMLTEARAMLDNENKKLNTPAFDFTTPENC
tara:strand:+ start:154 stop:450 length:297 start_codon:yes stop_codon:yes gene_type:complete